MNRTVSRQGHAPLDWTVQRRRNLVRITLGGELDIATAPGLDADVRPLAEIGCDLVVDLAELRFCGCAGLTLFVRWRSQAAAAGGSLCLVAPARIVRRLLAVTGTNDLLRVPTAMSGCPHSPLLPA